MQSNSTFDYVESEINIAGIPATLYLPKRTVQNSRMALLIHGFGGNRYGMQNISRKLASYGVGALSFDLPAHHDGSNKFMLGLCCDSVDRALEYCKNVLGCKSVALIGHSLGSSIALHYSMGFSSALEKNLILTWSNIVRCASQLDNLMLQYKRFFKKQEYQKGPDFEAWSKSFNATMLLFDENIKQLKKIVLSSLSNSEVVSSSRVNLLQMIDSYVLLSPVFALSKALPGIELLEKLPVRMVKALSDIFLHHPRLLVLSKSINDGIVPAQDVSKKPFDTVFRSQFFRDNDIKRLLNYYMRMKEPLSFLTLISLVIDIQNKFDQKSQFLNYYIKNYVRSPRKLFVYGTNDRLLKLRNKKNERALINNCKAFADNVSFMRGNFSHVIVKNPKQTNASAVVDRDDVLLRIVDFVLHGK